MSEKFRTAVVVGAGTAGLRLAAALTRAGVTVTVAGSAGQRTAALPPADLVIEAVPERVDTKRAVLAGLGRTYGPETVVASTSSAVPLTELATATEHPIVGLRPAGPPGQTRLIELSTGPGADEAILTGLRALVRRAGLTPAPVRAGVGTPLTRLLFGLLNRAAWLVHRGYVPPAVVDTAMEAGCGFAAGPFRLIDDIGAGTVRDVLQALYAHTGRETYRPAPPLAALAVGAPEQAEFAVGTTPGGARFRRIGVVGSGTMAAGIVRVLVDGGWPVTAVARSQAALERLAAALPAPSGPSGPSGPAGVALPMPAGRGWIGTTDLADLADCDLVIEAVVEDAAVKHDLLSRLDALCPPETVLATGTSSLSVTACAAATGRPDRVIGLHFFNPVPAMPLVEVVSTAHTAPAVADRAAELCRGLGKRIVRCGDEPGFVVNRLLFPFLNDAVALLHEGWSAAEIDRSVRFGMGAPMGPFRLLDVIGADVVLAGQRSLAAAAARGGAAAAADDPDLTPSPLLERIVDDGHLGDKSGRRVREHPLVAATPTMTGIAGPGK